MNYISNNLDVEGLPNALTHDGEGDRRMDRPAHFFDRILKSKALKIHLINRRDKIFGLNASLGRRSVFNW